MLLIRQIPFRRRRERLSKAVQPLTLVAATYASDDLVLILQFDRAISAAGVDVGQFQLFDGVFNFRSYVGGGVPTLDDPMTLRVELTELGAAGAGNVSMTAGAENGIVASGDGGTWSGVNDLRLPFPPP